MKQTNFENWETQDLEITFGSEKVKDMKLLSDWLDSVTEFDEIAKSMIEKLREHILDFCRFLE